MNVKRAELKPKKNSLTGITKENKVGVKSSVELKNTDSNKAVAANKLNPKQITIQLFNSKMKSSSKSTPMMSFKSGQEEAKEKELQREQMKENQREKTKVEPVVNPNRLSGEVLPSSRIKVNKLRDRVSITSKEDVMRHSHNNFNFTPEMKAGAVVKKRASIDATKAKSISINNLNQGLLTPQSSTNSTPTAQAKYSSNPQLMTSNLVLTTNYSDTHKEEFGLSNNLSTSPKKMSEANYLVHTIQTLGTLVKSSESPSKMNEILSTGQNAIKLNQLNSMLNNITLPPKKESEPKLDSMLNFHMNDSKNLLMENNVIRRDTFIDNNFNKKFQVEKENIMNEIYTTSDIRMKKYGILFEFINTNIKEITDMVSQNSTNRNAEEPVANNIIFDKEAVKALNEEDPSDKIKNNKLLHNISNSFIDSPSDLDFYKNLVDHTMNNNTCNDNFSQEMSSFRSKADCSQINDQTHLQYDDYYFKAKTFQPQRFLNPNDTCVVETVPELSVPRKSFIHPQTLLKQNKEANLLQDKQKEAMPNLDIKIAQQEDQSKCIIF